jgi:AAA+ superfamily predicted ATPase
MNPDLFEEVIVLPDPVQLRRYEGLVGLDPLKQRVEKEAEMLLRPERLEEWSRKQHGEVIAAVQRFKRRPPLIIFAGDVGCGKTTLAESFGDAVARNLNMEIHAYRLSLRARGTGAVGEMTTRLGDAFAEVASAASSAGSVGHFLIIDEADALAQSRSLGQMHHEDRAGVNALIRGVDRVGENKHPVLIIMITNRVEALDPAIVRRAAVQLQFSRPGDEQRKALLGSALGGVSLTDQEVALLVEMTGEDDHRSYGYTYSDLVDRVIPAAVIAAYPDRSITAALLEAEIRKHPPTPPFSRMAE